MLRQRLENEKQRRDQWFVSEVLPLEPMLVRFLRRNWPNASDIPDLLQETYARVYAAVQHSRPLHTKSFVYSTARNLMIDLLRKSQIVSIETLTDLEHLNVQTDEPDPERYVAGREELKLLQAVLDRLPSRCRRIVVLRKIELVSQREIVRRMGVTENIIEHDIAKAMRLFTEAIYGACGGHMEQAKTGALFKKVQAGLTRKDGVRQIARTRPNRRTG